MKAFLDYLCEIYPVRCCEYKLEKSHPLLGFSRHIHCKVKKSKSCIYEHLHLLRDYNTSHWRSGGYLLNGLNSYYITAIMQINKYDITWRFL